MSKRFTDTEKYKKPFVRGLKGAYKLLWDYLYHDCDHSGIWIVDFDIAQIYIGTDMPVNKSDALKYFNEGEKRIIEIDGGKKWFIKPFIEFQYGELNPNNRVHKSVISKLKKENVWESVKPLVSPLQGCKDKDTYKDKDKDKDKDCDFEKNNDGPRHRPESIDEVIEFFSKNGLGEVEARDFFHTFDEQGWVKGNGIAIVSWHSSARKWIDREIHSPPEWKKKEEKPFNPEIARSLRNGY